MNQGKKPFGYIYVITNVVSGKQYVGQTTQSVKERFSSHKTFARNLQNKTVLAHAMRSYGTEAFEVMQIDTASSREELDVFEQQYIKELNTICPNGYNLTTGGFGHNHHPDTKEKLRLRALENPVRSMLGRHHSLETKRLMSLAKLGTSRTPEQIKAQTQGIRDWWEDLRKDPESYEKHIKPFRERATNHLHTPEIEAKSAQNKIGTHPVYSQERNDKISQTLKEIGHKPSEECSQKAKDARRGTHHTEETKWLISEKKKGQEAHNKIDLSKEQEDIIRYLYKQKESITNIGKAIGGDSPIGKTAMTRIIKDLGIYEERSNKASLDDETLKMAKLMLSQGSSILSIKKELNLIIDPKTLKRLINHA